MNCPSCNVTLLMTDRSGVEIDYCPNCRGVWLDRGELDKIIERSAQSAPKSASTEPFQQKHHDSDRKHYDSDRKHYDSDHKHHDYKKKKHDSFLGDLFDF